MSKTGWFVLGFTSGVTVFYVGYVVFIWGLFG